MADRTFWDIVIVSAWTFRNTLLPFVFGLSLDVKRDKPEESCPESNRTLRDHPQPSLPELINEGDS
jgi:hypothetical protein